MGEHTGARVATSRSSQRRGCTAGLLDEVHLANAAAQKRMGDRTAEHAVWSRKRRKMRKDMVKSCVCRAAILLRRPQNPRCPQLRPYSPMPDTVSIVPGPAARAAALVGDRDPSRTLFVASDISWRRLCQSPTAGSSLYTVAATEEPRIAPLNLVVYASRFPPSLGMLRCNAQTVVHNAQCRQSAASAA